MTITKSWFSYLTRAFALSLCTGLLLNFVFCSDSSETNVDTTYTVSYSSTYGEPPASKTVKYGYVLTAEDLPVLTQNYCSFKGWLLDGASIAAGYIVKTDITLTAQWEVAASTYFITKENISEVIAAFTEDSTIVLSGELTSSDLAAVADAIKNSTYKVNLDLSQTTGLTSIPNGAFSSCSKLSGITIPDSVTYIGSYAFLNCESLSSVKIPNSVITIERYTFSHCYSLSSVTIPNSVIGIAEGAFFYCKSLSSVTIPDSVIGIDKLVFYKCSNLTSLTFADTTNWYRTNNREDWVNSTNGTLTDIIDPSANATYFKSTYDDYYWYKLDE